MIRSSRRTPKSPPDDLVIGDRHPDDERSAADITATAPGDCDGDSTVLKGLLFGAVPAIGAAKEMIGWWRHNRTGRCRRREHVGRAWAAERVGETHAAPVDPRAEQAAVRHPLIVPERRLPRLGGGSHLSLRRPGLMADTSSLDCLPAPQGPPHSRLACSASAKALRPLRKVAVGCREPERGSVSRVNTATLGRTSPRRT